MKSRAYAKINLFLKILRKRPDGYHDLETLFHPIDLYDDLELTATGSEISTVTRHSSLPSDESNLCLRAAHLLKNATHFGGGAHILLTKRIPLGAGLGGGSADAAAVLRGLNLLWNVRLPDETLRELAAQLGADVPFFLLGRSAYATGRGDLLSPVDISLPYWIVVATPPLHVSTSWAYAHCTPRNEDDSTHETLERIGNLADPATVRSLMVNDFEPSVMQAFPGIRSIKKLFLEHGAIAALMSGSGSSVFGLFAEESRARTVAASLAPDHVVSLTRPGFRPAGTDAVTP
jgi:4-diphosphocytidyl-2-C-methyl-D-erythritol kinase